MTDKKCHSQKPRLSPRQLCFTKEYLKDLNGTQSAIRAGYSKHTANEQASRLLANVNIQALLREEMEKRTKRTEITADYILTSLRNVAERCMQAEEVCDREGNPTGEYRFDSGGANKALELLGKNQKLFTEKIEHSGEVTAMKVELVFKGNK